MDADEYKKATGAPDVFRLAELDKTVRVLRHNGSSLADVIAAAPLAPIPKPARHRGDPSADFARVDLTLELVTGVVGELLDAEASAASPARRLTPETSRRAGLVDRWDRYQRLLAAVRGRQAAGRNSMPCRPGFLSRWCWYSGSSAGFLLWLLEPFPHAGCLVDTKDG